jgi:glycosyltransferase involved in cell wall biosynthesis
MKIKGGEIIYEVEELNSSKETKNIMKKIIFKFCEYTLFYIGDKFIITSINLKKYLKENKKYLLNRGYRISNLNIRINNDSKTPIILYSGNLDKVRGVEVFLESLKYIKYKCKIIITGKGNLQYKVSNYNNQNKNIKYSYKGFLNSEKYTELLIESKICINPIISNSDFSEKSFPSKILTYLQFYNLVISSKEYNFNEYNAIDKYIYTYSNDSAYELSMKINYLLKKLEKISFYDLKRDIKSYYDKTEFKLKKFIID